MHVGLHLSNPIREDIYEFKIYTYGSLTGWVAFCNSEGVNGHWKDGEKSRCINYLELSAAFFGLKRFANL